MDVERKPTFADIANKTGLKRWKVNIVLGNNATKETQRVTDDEIAIILHAAAELGYDNPGKGNRSGEKKKEITMAMVAKRAGVATSVVSNAFKPSGGQISRETRIHVLRIAKELGYKATQEKGLKNFYNSRK